MAIKGKISKVKRNNQKKQKLIKTGVIKKKGTTIKKDVIKFKREPIIQNNNKNDEDVSDESDIGEDMLQMVEDDDIEFLKNAITNRSYKIFNQIKYSKPLGKGKKRKVDEDTLEENYEKIDHTPVKMKNLLPIKTGGGVITRQVVDHSSKEDKVETPIQNNDDYVETQTEEDCEDEFSLETSELDLTKPISATQLLITRNELLRQRKIHIGTLSSGLLENPEEKVTNLRTLLKLMDEETPEIYITVRKLVIVSLLEVFKDVLPSYQIKANINDGVKLKKDTLKLQKYEINLLQYFKKFLQKLEKLCQILIKRKGDTRKYTEEEVKLGELAIHAMCDLLVSHPYFNFAENITQVVVPCLNNASSNVREIVKAAIIAVFKEDKKEEVTLKILRIINQYLKTHAHNVRTEMLEVLLVLKLKDVDLDREKEQEIKQKKLMSHKQNILQQSKKERKRKKKLQALEQELLETKAEENKQSKMKHLTEATKIMFNIYFRILKGSTNTKVLGVCLEGLAKFAHLINLEYYVDIVNLLDDLLQQDWLTYKERLHCIQTVFVILSGQGEVLNIDPTRFYNSLYRDLLNVNAALPHDQFRAVLETLTDSLVKRRKKITNKRTIGFLKRILTLNLQLLHNESIASLALVRNVMQLNRNVDILLDLDNETGDGNFKPELNDPEYSNAGGTALYELALLNRHYHPVVAKFAKNIAFVVPTSGDGVLAPELGKCTPSELYESYSMSEMAFNPPVMIPKKVHFKAKSKNANFMDTQFEEYCKIAMKTQIKKGSFCNL